MNTCRLDASATAEFVEYEQQRGHGAGATKALGRAAAWLKNVAQDVEKKIENRSFAALFLSSLLHTRLPTKLCWFCCPFSLCSAAHDAFSKSS